MAGNHGARQQKRIAKHKAKRAAKRAVLRRETSQDPTIRLQGAASWPVVHALAPDELFEEGIGYLLIAREDPEGRLFFAGFLADVYCLGVKNAFWHVGTREAFQTTIEKMEATQKMSPIAAERLAKIVHGAVDLRGPLASHRILTMSAPRCCSRGSTLQSAPTKSLSAATASLYTSKGHSSRRQWPWPSRNALTMLVDTSSLACHTATRANFARSNLGMRRLIHPTTMSATSSLNMSSKRRQDADRLKSDRARFAVLGAALVVTAFAATAHAAAQEASERARATGQANRLRTRPQARQRLRSTQSSPDCCR